MNPPDGALCAILGPLGQVRVPRDVDGHVDRHDIPPALHVRYGGWCYERDLPDKHLRAVHAVSHACVWTASLALFVGSEALPINVETSLRIFVT